MPSLGQGAEGAGDPSHDCLHGRQHHRAHRREEGKERHLTQAKVGCRVTATDGHTIRGLPMPHGAGSSGRFGEGGSQQTPGEMSFRPVTSSTTNEDERRRTQG